MKNDGVSQAFHGNARMELTVSAGGQYRQVPGDVGSCYLGTDLQKRIKRLCNYAFNWQINLFSLIEETSSLNKCSADGR